MLLPGNYGAMNCRERELTLDHIYTFLTTQGHGVPPRLRGQLNAEATSETARTWKTIHIICTPIHSNKANMKGWLWRRKEDYDGQMIFVDLVGLKLPDICLTGEEKPEKTSPRKLVPTGDRTRARCVTGAHSTSCSKRWTRIIFCDIYIDVLCFFQWWQTEQIVIVYICLCGTG